MKDLVILDVNGLINAHIRDKDKKATRIICENLLRFSWVKELLKDNPFKDNVLLSTIIIKNSSLTEKGTYIFQDLMYDWLAYTDNETGKIDRKNNIKMLEKYYSKIVKENEMKGK